MLKAALFLAFLTGSCLVSGSPASDVTDDIIRSVRHVHGLLLTDRLLSPLHSEPARRKRQVEWNSDETGVDDSTMCVLQCTLQMRSASERLQTRTNAMLGDEEQLTKPNVTRFIQACQAVRPSLQCFERCPRSSLTVDLQPTLDPLRFMCIDKFEDIKTNARCLTKISSTITSQCKPQCQQYDTSMRRLKQIQARPDLRFLYSADELSELVSDTCQSIQCSLDCMLPIIRTTCGDKAADIIRTMIQKTMKAAQNQRVVPPGALPASCTRLAQPASTQDQSDEDNPSDIGQRQSMWSGGSYY